MYNTLLLTIDNNVAVITMNRPDVFNAFNNEMSYELQDALKQVKRDENVRVVVLTGAGDKAFCSGQDLKDARSMDQDRAFYNSVVKRYNPIIKAMRTMPKPIIGRVNGVAAGAGCSLALACDFIIAAEHARLIEVFVNIGLVMDSGSSYFLPRTVGSVKAFELATMGNKVSAAEALQLGMINRVAPAGELDAVVKEVTDYYATAPTKAIGIMKAMLNKSQTADLDTMLQYEAYCQEIAGTSEDYKEGVAAFREKRKPEFKGK